MIFRQLFEPLSSTYTYLIGCESTRKAVLIDPVIETVERDLEEIRSLGLNLVLTLETHIHADHLTGALKLKSLAGSRIAAPNLDGLSCVDIGVEEGQSVHVGELVLQPLFTPGHTDHHHAYFVERAGNKRVFTGDALLIDGCGRTDFQGGDCVALFHSVRDKLFGLSTDTLVYPAHDYQGRFVSSIAQEQARNPRLGLDKSQDEFCRIMSELKLPFPTKMPFAVPGNQLCGQCPPNTPDEFRQKCAISDQG